MSRRRPGQVGALLITLATASGCSSYDLAALEGDQAPFQRLAADWGGKTGGRRILVAPVIVRPPGAGSEDETKSAAMRFDRQAFQRELTRALGGVVTLTDSADLPRLTQGADLATWKRQVASVAWEQQADYVLYVTIEKWHAEFVETNGWWWPNAFFLGWYFWPIGPQWWIADEDYGVDLVLSLELQRVASETPLPGLSGRSLRVRTVDAPEEPSRRDVVAAPRLSLDDLDRGPDLFGTWVSGSLDADQWEQVGALLDPYARRVAAIRTAVAVADGVHAFASMDAKAKEQVLAKMATTHALVVGISDYPDEACPGAQADAEEVGQLLRSQLTAISGKSGAVEAALARWAPAKNVIVLRNAQATVAAITSALTALQRRAEPQDQVVLYFAGRGRRTAAGLSVRAYPGSGAADLQLSRLGQLLRAIPAARRVVLIDAGFGAGPRGSANPPGAAVATRAALTQRLTRTFLAGATRGGVVLAADLTSRAHAFEVEQRPRGLLTAFLTRGLRGEADAGGDGLTWEDLSTYLERVSHLADVALDHPQRPLVIGKGPIR